MKLRSCFALALALFPAGCSSPPETPPVDAMANDTTPAGPFRGIYTVTYRVPDLAAAKAWYSQAFRIDPYFDEPFYVGFNVAGYELGLQPAEGEDMAGPGGSVAYWGVENADSTFARLIGLGATARDSIQDVGGGVRIGSVNDPFGNVLGVVQNSEFKPLQ